MIAVMLKMKSPALMGILFVISVLQVSGAFEIELGEDLDSDLISFTINQCPDMSGDFCRFNHTEPLLMDIKFKTRVSFETARAEIGFKNYYWISAHPESDGVLRAISWKDFDVCQSQDSFCPAEEGDERTYKIELEVFGSDEIWTSPGLFGIYMLTEHSNFLLNLKIPMIGYC